MIPPTSIDGTDITGATIDGTDVQEITVDGDVVFSAGPDIPEDPVAQSSLIAWYPFANAASDVTAGDSSFGDTTDYSGTVNGATQQASGGVVDIFNQTENSEYYAFDGSNDDITLPDYGFNGTDSFTMCLWVIDDGITGDGGVAFALTGELPAIIIVNGWFGSGDSVGYVIKSGSTNQDINITGQGWTHLCLTFSSANGVKFYRDGVETLSDSSISSVEEDPFSTGENVLGGSPFFANENRLNGDMDDVRVYDSELSQSQVNEIVTNTDPNA